MQIRYVARKWLLDEIRYRNRPEFGIIPGSRKHVPNVPPVLVQAVSCGSRHTACITARGEVMTWGCDHRGALGRPLIPPLVHDASLPPPLSEDETKAMLAAKKKVRCVSPAVSAAVSAAVAVVLHFCLARSGCGGLAFVCVAVCVHRLHNVRWWCMRWFSGRDRSTPEDDRRAAAAVSDRADTLPCRRVADQQQGRGRCSPNQ